MKIMPKTIRDVLPLALAMAVPYLILNLEGLSDLQSLTLAVVITALFLRDRELQRFTEKWASEVEDVKAAVRCLGN